MLSNTTSSRSVANGSRSRARFIDSRRLVGWPTQAYRPTAHRASAGRPWQPRAGPSSVHLLFVSAPRAPRPALPRRTHTTSPRPSKLQTWVRKMTSAQRGAGVGPALSTTAVHHSRCSSDVNESHIPSRTDLKGGEGG